MVHPLFEAHLPHQDEAIDAAVRLFEGQASSESLDLGSSSEDGRLFGASIVANPFRTLDTDLLLNQLQEVQATYGLTTSSELDGLNFSVEMETGTGKTYVYLRTIYEMHARYGASKFVIVVPSVAIREGVLSQLRMLREHFEHLYGRVPCDYWAYDSKQVSHLRQFSSGTSIQILIINIDSFNRAANNVIHQAHDSMAGLPPIEFIRACNPIVILDEPQNMESANARAAIESLSPLCTLRYSATHRHSYNLIYRLDPVRAIQSGLVKEIEVLSVLDTDLNRPFMRLRSVEAGARGPSAKLQLDGTRAGEVQRRIYTVRATNVSLRDITERPVYDDFVVSAIDASEGTLSFTNGLVLRVGEEIGPDHDAIMRLQVQNTVEEHLRREAAIQESPHAGQLKVLSLFFIDRVANYVPSDGKIRLWFEEAYAELTSTERFAYLGGTPAHQVHAGYFSESRRGEARDTGGETQADEDTYALIMQNKERLLDPAEPIRFIFSHSALREGWDNPNVFQICTLNETRSELKKRQEIGRGLRLPVFANGNRCREQWVNRLTVVANEAYEDFARALQSEIQDDCGVDFGRHIHDRRERVELQLKSEWEKDPALVELWGRISRRTSYRVSLDGELLVQQCTAAVSAMGDVAAPSALVTRASLQLDETGVTAAVTAIRSTTLDHAGGPMPDVLGQIVERTGLTRASAARILVGSGRLADFSTNPQQAVDQAAAAIKSILIDAMVGGVEYEQIDGSAYELRLFDEHQTTAYLSACVDVSKSNADRVVTQSEVEARFARALEAREDVAYFLKLPGWFVVPTPVGDYVPDWAIVKRTESGDRLYLVRETKGTHDLSALRATERYKVECGQEHFEALQVSYAVVTSADEI